jgi:hypothetical protein
VTGKPNVRDYFGEGELTEEDRRLWPFIYEIVSRPTDNSWIGVVRTEPFLVISSGTLLTEWLNEPGQ